MKHNTSPDLVKSFFTAQIAATREESPELFSSLDDNVVFAFLCIKYYIADDSASDEEILGKIILNTHGDGIFAICTYDKDSEKSTVVATFDYSFGTEFDAYAEPRRISATIKRVLNCSDEVKTSDDLREIQERLSACREECEDAPGKTLVMHFTATTPRRENTKQKARKNLEDALRDFHVPGIISDIHFGKAIKDWIEGALSGDGRISEGTLEIDTPGNCLKYSADGIGNAIIVNLSAKSLQGLYNDYGKNLLGLNLRYHVKGKVVDAGIAKTIQETPHWFWCLNNGMVIVCDDFRLDGNTLTLSRFSIVNGGQTTVQVSRMDDSVCDFSIPCKIIKTLRGESALEPNNIAIASNSQKPIKPGDLAANGKEQLSLKAWFKQRGWQYIIKQGEKTEKQYKNQKISLDKLGKLVLASLLQMPWVRSSAKDLYDMDKPYYHLVYGDGKSTPKYVSTYPELIFADKSYNDFTKTILAKNSANPKVTNNARTVALATIVYLSWYFQNGAHPVQLDDIYVANREYIGDEKPLLKAMQSLRKIFKKNMDGKTLHRLYAELANSVFLCAYNNRVQGGENASATDESGFFKSPDSYLQCLRQLRARLADDESEFSRICRQVFPTKE